jgi:hypothetical protein
MISVGGKSVWDKHRGQPHDNNDYCDYLDFTILVELTENIRSDHYISSHYAFVSVLGPAPKRTSHSSVNIAHYCGRPSFLHVARSRRCPEFGTGRTVHLLEDSRIRAAKLPTQ